eukprot:gene8324-23774_t
MSIVSPGVRFQRAARQVFVVSYLCYACIYFGRKPLSVVKSAMGEELGLSSGQMGWIETSYLASYAAGQFLLTPFGDRMGSRRMLSWIFLVSAASTALFSMNSSYTGFILLYGISGFAQSAAFPLCVKALAPWFSAEHRGMVLGTWTTSQQLGGVISTSVAGYLAITYGWKVMFLSSSAPLMAAAIVLNRWLIETPEDLGEPTLTAAELAEHIGKPVRGRKDAASGAAAAATSKQSIRNRSPSIPQKPEPISALHELELGQTVAEIAPRRVSPTFRRGSVEETPPSMKKSDRSRPGGGSSSAGMVGGGFMTVVKLPGVVPLGVSYLFVKLAAYFSTLFDVGGMIGSLGIGKLSDGLFKGKRVLMAAIMCWGTAMALVASNTVKEGDKVMEGVMLMLIGAMIGGPDSVLGGACTQDTCERAGASAAVLATACGITNGFGSVGAIAQGPISAYLTDEYGWSTLFNFLGVLCCCGGIALVPLIFPSGFTLSDVGSHTSPVTSRARTVSESFDR